MAMKELFRSDDYSDGRTKQAYKDDADISKILARAARGDAISHLAKYGATYGDFTDVDDLLSAHARLERGKKIFSELPGEIRREFANDVGRFFAYVNDPENAPRLGELLPGLTKPGNQLPQVVRTPATENRQAAPQAAQESAPATPPQTPPEGAQ